MKKNVMFIIPSLSGGGAERVLVNLLGNLDRSRFAPFLVIFDDRNDYPGEIPSDVETASLHSLDKRGIRGHLRLIRAISLLMKRQKPDVICSFMEYANHLSSLAKRISRCRAPLFFTQHNMMSFSYRPGRLRSARLIRSILKHLLYPPVEGIICVSEGVREDMITNWAAPREKTRVIYNPFDVNKIQRLSQEPVADIGQREGENIVISCGRLTEQKNYHLLLRAFSIVVKELPSARLLILGEGELKGILQDYAEQLGIAERVIFEGFQHNPYKYIAKAALLVLSSSWEGFGNVLVEAMACGTAVISTRCPSGPEEIIADGVNGLLVPVQDENALAQSTIRVLKDIKLRMSLIAGGTKRAMEFDIKKIVAEYEQVF
jgi:glycosyltransferase involved in cell wall biosynthesis